MSQEVVCLNGSERHASRKAKIETSSCGHGEVSLMAILMRMKQTGHLLIQLANLLLKELQLLQCHLQQPTVYGLEVRARTERITQLFRRGA